MSISLGNAIKCIKEDNNWVKKLLIGGVVSLLLLITSALMDSKGMAVCVTGTVLYILLSAFLSGFCVSTGNKMLNSDSNTMTDWNEGNLLVKGVKFLLSLLVYSFVITAIFTVVVTVFLIILSLILGAIYYLFSLVVHANPLVLGQLLMVVVFGTFITIFLLYLIQFINAAHVCYYKKFSFKDMMSLKKQFLMIKENQHASWTLIGKLILYMLLFILINIVAIITLIGIVIIPFVCFAAYIIIVNLYAQYGREIEVGKYVD